MVEKNMRAENRNADESDLLAQVDARLARALKPIPPTPTFRARLRNRLAMATHPRIVLHRRSDPRVRWLIGAAALGSVAGVIAIVLRARSQRADTQSPTA